MTDNVHKYITKVLNNTKYCPVQPDDCADCPYAHIRDGMCFRTAITEAIKCMEDSKK